MCRTPSSVTGNPPFIYLRAIQNAVVSLMDGIAREFVDVPAQDRKSEEEELRSYACGSIRDDWHARSR